MPGKRELKNFFLLAEKNERQIIKRGHENIIVRIKKKL